jgi:tRNA A-37 threonylcarbamoyl transferase component Bud32
MMRFENYAILQKEDGAAWELGRGAMGITYKAQDTDLHVPVALKVINPTTLDSTDALDRFLREARAAAKLRHPNIASVFRLGKVGETHFYAMEFCEGQTVHQLVERRGALELRLALEITLQVASALTAAQDHGVVHRDIKPSNLMVTGRVPEEFTVKVIDFGLAKHTATDAAASDITLSSHRRGFVGTAHFASPEQLEDRPVDPRSDIYSLGVTLWFMLTGRPLFEGSLTRVVTQHLVQTPPIEKLSWLPPAVATLLESMLAKNPDERPRHARELRSRLQACLESLEFPRSISVPTPAGVLAGRFELQAPISTVGVLHRAADLTLGSRAVLVAVLPPDAVPDAAALEGVDRDLKTLKEHPHPALLAAQDRLRDGARTLISFECIDGIPLAEAVSAQGRFAIIDLVRLLRHITEAFDHTSRWHLHRLDLDPRQVLLRFVGVDPDSARRSVLTRSPAEWPACEVRANPLGPSLVIDPALRMRALVKLTLELLGAPPSASGFVPVGQLTAGGNELLQAALEGRRQFASAADFLAALNSFAALQSASAARASVSVAAPGGWATLVPDQSAVTQHGIPAVPAAKPPPPPPPPTTPPPYYPPPAPQPITSAKPFLVVGAMLLLVMLVVAIAGVAVAPWGRGLLGMHQRKPTPAPATPIPGVNQRDLDDAFREARMAEDAAEKLSEMLSRFDINRRLIKLSEERPQPDAEALEAYRLAEQTIERQIIDSEGALLLHAKRFQTYTPEVQALAFDRLDQQVASVGVNWRTRVAELLRRQIPKIPAESTRVDPAFREELKKLQSPP